MSEALVRIVAIPDTGDERGSSFSMPEGWQRFLPELVDLHLTTIRPGHVRGNHYHARHREILIVVHRDRWSFYWDLGPGTPVTQRDFAGTGATLIEIAPLVSHAVGNTGKRDLLVAGLSDVRYNPEHPDAYPRPVR